MAETAILPATRHGRPSSYTAEKAELICERIANGESLSRICKTDEMPSTTTVFKWLGENKPFLDSYARAREAQADALADEILDIADDGENDKILIETDGETITKIDYDHIQRSKLRVDTRKWIAGKLKPKKYGDFSRLEHSGPNGSPITFASDPAQIESAFVDSFYACLDMGESLDALKAAFCSKLDALHAQYVAGKGVEIATDQQ